MSEAELSSGRREGRGLVPEYFNKEELQYEIRLRGGVPQGDVASLRKQLRELLAGDVPLQRVEIEDLEEELALCADKWTEFSTLMEDSEYMGSSTRVWQRVTQKMHHLSDRLRNLLSQDGLEEEVRRAATALQSKICLPSEVQESPSKQKEMLTCQAVATERVDLLGGPFNALVEERPLIS